MLSPDVLDSALAPARDALRWGAACTAATAAVGALVSGWPAGAAAAVGGVAGVLAGRSLVQGLASAFATAQPARRAGRLAILAALLRYPLLGAVIALAVGVLDLPAGWLALGVTAWPAALGLAAARRAASEVPNHAPLAPGATPRG